jgi:hypothetical protein
MAVSLIFGDVMAALRMRTGVNAPRRRTMARGFGCLKGLLELVYGTSILDVRIIAIQYRDSWDELIGS